MQDEHGKKSPGTGAVTGADNAANAPVKPTVLSDDELDGVAGGGSSGGTISLHTGTMRGTLETSLGNERAFTIGRSKP